MINQAIVKLGENLAIRRFVRFKVGEVSGGASSSSDNGASPASA